MAEDTLPRLNSASTLSRRSSFLASRASQLMSLCLNKLVGASEKLVLCSTRLVVSGQSSVQASHWQVKRYLGLSS